MVAMRMCAPNDHVASFLATGEPTPHLTIGSQCQTHVFMPRVHHCNMLIISMSLSAYDRPFPALKTVFFFCLRRKKEKKVFFLEQNSCDPAPR